MCSRFGGRHSITYVVPASLIEDASNVSTPVLYLFSGAYLGTIVVSATIEFRLKSMAKGRNKNSHNSPMLLVLKPKSVMDHVSVVFQRSVPLSSVYIMVLAINCPDMPPKKQKTDQDGTRTRSLCQIRL